MRPETSVRLLQCGLLLAGCILCAVISLPAAGVMLLTGLMMLVPACIADRRRQKQTAALCEEIDRILCGAEQFSLAGCTEGELGILSAEIRKMTVRLREQNAALSRDKQFLREALEDMSHQLRTPLTTSMLLLGMLRKTDLTREERICHVQELCTMLSRMQWMLETLLSLSRLEAGAVHFQPETFPVRELIRNALEPLGISLELAGITVETRIEGEPEFYADKAFCAEALTNLLKNCMEHTPEGGCIAIAATENALYTGLTVTDSGDGIAPEDLPHVFERFYRGKSFSGSGYGIGLSFAQRIIAAQGGSLTARNAGGAQFDWRMYRQIP